MFNLASTRTPSFSSAELLSSQSTAILLHRVTTFSMKDCICFCWTLRFLSLHFSSLPRFSQQHPCPPMYWPLPLFVVIHTLAEKAFCTVIQVVNEDIKEIPEGSRLLLATSWTLRLTLWAWRSGQFSMYLVVHLPSCYITNLGIRRLCQTLIKFRYTISVLLALFTVPVTSSY